MREIKQCLLANAALFAVCLLTGCATGAKSAKMVPTMFAVENKHAASVHATVGGGEDTNPLLMSKISSSEFLSALSESVTRSGVFASVVNAGDADYLLQVTLLDLDQPFAGFDMTVDLVTSWKLTRRSTNELVFGEKISTSYTAKVGDAFVGVDRLRMANEGAARENIKEGIRRLSTLKF